MAGEDRLSELPDDLLRRVLHFAPAKEAASTTALSRHWRTALWRSSGAVNLETRVQKYDHRRYYDSSPEEAEARRDAFVSAALAALDATADGGHVKRLTLLVESDGDDNSLDEFLNRNRYNNYEYEENPNVVDVVLSHLAARRVEELRLQVAQEYKSESYYDDKEIFWSQCIIDAAPELSAVCLESVQIDDYDIDVEEEDDPLHSSASDARPPPCSFWTSACGRQEPASSTATPAPTMRKPSPFVAAEIHAPRLHRFRYKGLLRPFSLSPQPPELEQVDLEFFPDTDYRNNDPDRDLATFWRLVRSFTSAKDMKLSIKLEAIAVVSKAMQAELLPAFSSLRRLELHGVHRENVKKAGVAIANLLRCCPVLRDLRINLTTEDHHTSKNHEHTREFLKRKFRSSRDNPIDRFDCGCDSGEGDDEAISSVAYDEVSEIPALSRRSFQCLQSLLSRVGLRFRF
uniref:Uncharacterized protein n=1 Tax=Aegilops tauschii TaxID=37682 RepID=N1QRI0_AEGTA